MKLALHLALLFLAFTLPARAHNIEYGTGAICSTQEQAERLAVLLDYDEHTAIAMVNVEEDDPHACLVQTVAFVRGASLATVRSKTAAFTVVVVLVVGVDQGGGFGDVTPGAYFMLVSIDERSA